MLISKFDLYKPEWLELVFADRNKDYGAYYLRQHYAGNMVKAMVITFSGITLLCGAGVIFKSAPPQTRAIVVEIPQPPVVAPPPEKAEKKPEPPLSAKPPKTPPAPTVPTTRLVPLVVTSAPSKAENPPKIDELPGAVGPTTAKGTGPGDNTLPVDQGGTGTPASDISIYTTGDHLDEMPAPVGGESAWSKFLNKNLRYPIPAQEEGVSGKVILSFVIEKDGSLSNIVVERPANHGFDEEAVRVLKLAKAWKPGKQNGQPVRVKYTITINFQIADDN